MVINSQHLIENIFVQLFVYSFLKASVNSKEAVLSFAVRNREQPSEAHGHNVQVVL